MSRWRGATPPELCGGPTGYQLTLKRQNDRSAMLVLSGVGTGILALAVACSDQPSETWEIMGAAIDESLRSINRRPRSNSKCNKPERDNVAWASCTVT